MLPGIKTYLEQQGVSGAIRLGSMPDQPDNCIALFEYAGSPPDLHWPGEYPGLQVRVRDTDYPDGRARIEEVIQALHGLYEQTLDGARYLLIKARHSPEVLKRDASDRIEFFVNFDVMKEVKAVELDEPGNGNGENNSEEGE